MGLVSMLGGIFGCQSASDVFKTPAGEKVQFYCVKHGSFYMSVGEKWIYADPVGAAIEPATDYSKLPKADYILVTHEHHDHMDPQAIQDLVKPGTIVIANPAAAAVATAAVAGASSAVGDFASAASASSAAADAYADASATSSSSAAASVAAAASGGTVMAIGNGQTLTLPEGWTISAVPAYNYSEGKLNFHPKGRDNGYILDLGGFRVYVAGDTEDIPEMSDIKDIDVAFLPCNLPYTMSIEQCAAAARTVSPRVLFPYHYGETRIENLVELLSVSASAGTS